jgi:hypothetical protein
MTSVVVDTSEVGIGSRRLVLMARAVGSGRQEGPLVGGVYLIGNRSGAGATR